MSLKSDCLFLIKSSLEAINPQKLIKQNLKLLNDNRLLVNNKSEFQLNRNVYVAAFGKAVKGMYTEVENIIGKHIVKGVAILPTGSKINSIDQVNNDSKIKVFYGAHNNLPDEHAYQAAKELYEMCKSLERSDLLITLISGGGSALLPLPVDEISLNEKISTIKLIASAGASINELNCVRMCLSKVKGGNLAKCAYPATVVSLIISDVINDPLDVISSGPTYVTHLYPRYKDALNIITKYGLDEKIPKNVMNYLIQNDTNNKKVDDAEYLKNLQNSVFNFLIGNNKLATEAINISALDMNYKPTILLTNSLNGEAKEWGRGFAYMAYILANIEYYKGNVDLMNKLLEDNFGSNILDSLKEYLSKCISSIEGAKRLCILVGGETTVNLFDNNESNKVASGLGGRNQEMTLSFKKTITELYQKLGTDSSKTNIIFSSFGTDGIDGPTDAAGAFAHSPFTYDKNDMDYIIQSLKEHNSYSYFQNNSNLLKTGHTGTNVADIQILLIEYI